jgi:carboxypeptidase T
MMKLLPLALAAALSAAALAHAHPNDAEHRALRAAERQQDNLYRAYFPDLATGRKAAVTFHAQLIESAWQRGHLVLELEPADIATLQRFGFRVEAAPDMVERRNRFLDAFDAVKAGSVGAQAIPGFPCYETVEESFAAGPGAGGGPSRSSPAGSMPATPGRRPAAAAATTSACSSSATPRWRRRPGRASPSSSSTAAIHAREYATAPLVLEFARQLVNGHGVDADATWVLDHHELHLMLHTNPDGRKRAETGLSWRKNTNNNHCANSNTRGVDLNRNFSHSWNVTNGEGSSGSACSLTYRGPSAGSEPETQAVEAYVRSLWPDRRGPNPGDAAPADTSGIHLDIHSFSQLVLWPWGDSASPAPNGAALATLGRRFAWFNGYTPMQSVGLYPTDGTSDAVSYGELGVPAYTFELGTSFFESCATFTSSIKPGNLPALMYAAKVVRAPYLTPSGPQITELSLAGQRRGRPGGAAKLQATASDLRFNQSEGSEATQAIAGAEAYVDTPPWLPGAVALPLSPATAASTRPTRPSPAACRRPA